MPVCVEVPDWWDDEEDDWEAYWWDYVDYDDVMDQLDWLDDILANTPDPNDFWEDLLASSGSYAEWLRRLYYYNNPPSYQEMIDRFEDSFANFFVPALNGHALIVEQILDGSVAVPGTPWPTPAERRQYAVEYMQDVIYGIREQHMRDAVLDDPARALEMVEVSVSHSRVYLTTGVPPANTGPSSWNVLHDSTVDVIPAHDQKPFGADGTVDNPGYQNPFNQTNQVIYEFTDTNNQPTGQYLVIEVWFQVVLTN